MKRDIIVPLPTPLGPHTTNGFSVRRRCECDVVVAAGTPDDRESVGEEKKDDGVDIMLHWTTEDFLITPPPLQHMPFVTPPMIDFDSVDRMLHPIRLLLMVVTNVTACAD
jgi:hypothetical protein